MLEEDEKIVEEINDKKSYEEIALEHSRNIGGIKSRGISHIIYPKYKNENISIDDLSIEYNIDKEIINKQINKLEDKEIINRQINKLEDKEIINKQINKLEDKEIINRQINKKENKDILIRIEKKLDKIISYLIKE